MDTSKIEFNLMADAAEMALANKHTLAPWESFQGGAVRIAHCLVCHRFALVEVFPHGDQNTPKFNPDKVHDWGESGMQVYSTEFRGAALLIECSPEKATK